MNINNYPRINYNGPRHEKTCFFVFAKRKVTSQLTSGFVFETYM